MPKRLNSISPMVDNFMSRRLGEADRVEEKREGEEERQESGRNYDRVTISHLGKVLNYIGKKVRESNDPKVKRGFEMIMNLIGNPPSNLIAVGFADLSAALEEKESPNFTRLFKLAYQLGEEEMGLKEWINSLINLQLDQIENHFTITEMLITYHDRQSLQNYLAQLNQIAFQDNLAKRKKIKKINELMNDFLLNKDNTEGLFHK